MHEKIVPGVRKGPFQVVGLRVNDGDGGIEADALSGQQKSERKSDRLGSAQDDDPLPFHREPVVAGDLDGREGDCRDLNGRLGDQTAEVRGSHAVDVLGGSQGRDRAVEVERGRQGMLEEHRMDARVSVQGGQSID